MKRTWMFVAVYGASLGMATVEPAQAQTDQQATTKQQRSTATKKKKPSSPKPAAGHTGHPMPSASSDQQMSAHEGMNMPAGQHDMSQMPGRRMGGAQRSQPPAPAAAHNMPGMQMVQPAQQEQQQSMPAGHQTPGMQMGGNIEDVIKKSPSNFLPALGSGQVVDSQQVITLEDLEQRALRGNPTMRQAQAEIAAAHGRRVQAGLWPNPTIAYSGEEIRGGQFGAGQHGAFIEQRFVLGRKLALSRNVAGREVAIAEVEAEEQKLRVLTAVRVAYFEVLTSQEALNLARHNIELTKANLVSSQRFNNIGQTDRSEVLQADIEVQRQELAASIEETRLRRDWHMLAALIGEPTLPLTRLDGRLEQNLPSENGQQLLEALLSSSPAVKIADTNVSRSEAILARSRRESVPDLSVRAGLQQNNESLESANRKVGLQGFAEVGVQIPIFNRNQGNVSAARAELDRAKAEAERVRLVLRQRASAMVQTYNMSQQTVSRYQQQILPKARQLFDMQLKAWGQMTASYPQVLIAQQTLFSAQREYIQALQQLRTSSLALRGFLLTDGLEAPSRPGEVDMPVRELNVPGAGGTER